MFSTVLALTAAYTTTKAVRDALFLSSFGLTELSYVMIGIAVVSGFSVSLFTRATVGVSRDWLIFGTNATIAVTLVAAAPGLSAGWPWLAWALYLWSSVFGLVIVAEFWLLANDLFDARQARRLFPIIGAGAILGGVVGGALSGWLARPLGSANLLYIVAVLLMLAAWLAHVAWRRRPHDARVDAASTPRWLRGAALVRRQPYVRLIAVMMACMTVCMTLVQWQYKGIAKAHFGARQDDMTAFFGTLAAVLNSASFLLQLVGTPRLLQRFGVGFGLRVLPAGFLVGAAALLASTVAPLGALTAASVAMLLSDGFRFSVDKASVELLYLPIPRAVKDQAKPFIDTVVDRASGAFAGFLWLFLTWALRVDRPARIAQASFVTVGIVAAWLIVIARARRRYIDAYRHMLAPPRAGAAAEDDGRRARAWARVLADALGLDAPARTRALRRLTRGMRAEPALRLERADIEPHLVVEARLVGVLVRARHAERVEPHAGRPLLLRALDEQLDHSLERVARLLATVYPARDILAAHRALRAGPPLARAGALELLDNLLGGESKLPLLQALDEMALGGRAPRRPAREASLRALLQLDDRWLRACAAHAAGGAGLLVGELARLSRDDPDPLVREAAGQAVARAFTRAAPGGA
jgi:hypothetical protein